MGNWIKIRAQQEDYNYKMIEHDFLINLDFVRSINLSDGAITFNDGEEILAGKENMEKIKKLYERDSFRVSLKEALHVD